MPQAQIPHAQDELNRVEAQQKVLQLQFDRLNGVAQVEARAWWRSRKWTIPQGKALASAAQVEAAKSNLQSAESVLAAAQAKREHDQALFDYSKITAPFAGVVTQRYANLGTLMQAGTSSSTQAMPLVQAFPGRSFPAGDSGAGILCSFHSSRRSGERQRPVAEPDLSRKSSPLLGGCSRRHAHHAHRSGRAESQPRPASGPVRGSHHHAGEERRRHRGPPAGRGSGRTTRPRLTLWIRPTKSKRRRIVLGIQTATDAEVLSGLQEGELVVVSDRSGLKAGQPVQPKMIDLMQYQSSEEQH